MPKVSVIVPVYGVEKYIERCARSLFEQTLDDIEFIFVDDCTPDRSIEILKSVIEKFRLRFVEKKYEVRIVRMPTNSGQADVRRHGIQLAKGDYIIHCDSDDWVDVTMYEKMYNKAIETGSDVVVCDFCRTNGEDKSSINIGAHTTEIKTFLLNCLFQRDQWSLWNKLFKITTYSKEIHYPTGALGEDMVLCLQLLNNCKSMSYVKDSLYNYYYNPNSITRKKTVANCLNNFYTLKNNTDIISQFIIKELQFNKKTKNHAISYLRMVNSFSLLPIRHIHQYRKLWKENSQSMGLSFFFIPQISVYYKFVYCLSCLPFYPTMQKRINQ